MIVQSSTESPASGSVISTMVRSPWLVLRTFKQSPSRSKLGRVGEPDREVADDRPGERGMSGAVRQVHHEERPARRVEQVVGSPTDVIIARSGPG